MFTELSNAELMKYLEVGILQKLFRNWWLCSWSGISISVRRLSVMTMGVGAALACGPVGWACVGLLH